MKTHVLIVSRNFTKSHKKAGRQTWFFENIINGSKMHTIRADEKGLCEKRIKDVQDGKAILSIRYWTGKPYFSKQREVTKLTSNDDIGIQKVRFLLDDINNPAIQRPELQTEKAKEVFELLFGGVDVLAANDGLSVDDFKEWFKNYDLSKPMTVIHFTNFRY